MGPISVDRLISISSEEQVNIFFLNSILVVQKLNTSKKNLDSSLENNVKPYAT